MDFIEACRKFISLDSSPSNGNKELVEFAAQLAQGHGLITETQEDSMGDQDHANIIVRTQERTPTLEFLLQTHLDTADPGPYRLWQNTNNNPFDATIIDGRLYGLGASDTKLDFLCKLEALASFKHIKNWKLPPVLIGTYGEEQGMLGMLKLIRKNKFNAKMALVGEPSGMNIIRAAKGYASVEIKIPFNQEEIIYRDEHNLKESTTTQTKIFHGKSAHSSMPHLGESAIHKMLEYLLQLPHGIMIMQMDGGDNMNTVPSHATIELDFVSIPESITQKIVNIYQSIKELEIEFKKYNDEEFTPSHPTLNLGLLRTTDAYIKMGGSCRIPPIVGNEIYEQWIQRLKDICSQYGAEFRVLDYKKPYRTSDNSILVRNCLDISRKISLSSKLSTQASTNESSLLSRIGIECVSFGPGERENVHISNENVKIDDLYKAIEFYKQAIERFCL